MDYRTANKLKAHTVACLHLFVIVLNLAAVPMLILHEPFWIWMPIITFGVSPLMGGTYCIFNRLENHYRQKAGLPLIHDRTYELFKNLGLKEK
jgi:hypothetical protein